MAGKRPVVELARAYLKHHRTRAQQDSWAFDEVLQRVSLGPADPEDAWNVVLALGGFREDEHFDVFHVLMARGGYCDCEILYNAVEVSRLKAEYWRARAAQIEPYDPHVGPRGSRE